MCLWSIWSALRPLGSTSGLSVSLSEFSVFLSCKVRFYVCPVVSSFRIVIVIWLYAKYENCSVIPARFFCFGVCVSVFGLF